MSIGLCSALKMNQWLGSRAAQSMAGKPARLGGGSGNIMRAFAKAPQVTSTEATTESCSHIAQQSTRSISQGTEVTLLTEYVPY